MKAIFSCVLMAIALTGCSGDGSLPNPTGKGSVRVINAIPTAPTINALIEERALGQIDYKESTGLDNYDDFEYRFNFEAFLAGDSVETRVASRVLKIEKDTEFNIIVRGDIASPTISVESRPERTFEEGATNFELQVGHLAEGFPDVDVYFAETGVVPMPGQQIATLELGQFAAPRDFPAGDYVMTITPANDPGTIVFQSDSNTYNGAQSLFVAALAPDANDTDPLAVRAYLTSGSVATIPDTRSQPTLRFIHGASDLGAVDLYLDEALTTPILQNVTYGDISDDFEADAGEGDFYLTPAGETTSVLFENGLVIGEGTRTHIAVLGNSGTYASAAYRPDRRSVSTIANLQILNLALDFPIISVYVLERGATIQEDDRPRIINTVTGAVSGVAGLIEEGSFDAYITLSGTTTAIAGPLELEIQYGDLIDLVFFDTDDPNVGELVEIPPP